MIVKHEGFEVNDGGLFINPEWGHIGASPDGLVKCNCCMKGVVEIKCPHCHRSNTIRDSAEQDKRFCFKKNADGLLRVLITLILTIIRFKHNSSHVEWIMLTLWCALFLIIVNLKYILNVFYLINTFG